MNQETARVAHYLHPSTEGKLLQVKPPRRAARRPEPEPLPLLLHLPVLGCRCCARHSVDRLRGPRRLNLPRGTRSR